MENVAIMIEEAAAQEWERLNMPTDGETLRMAARSLGFAIDELDSAADSVNEAVELLVDTPEGDRLASVLEELESILKMLKSLQKEWGRTE